MLSESSNEYINKKTKIEDIQDELKNNSIKQISKETLNIFNEMTVIMKDYNNHIKEIEQETDANILLIEQNINKLNLELRNEEKKIMNDMSEMDSQCIKLIQTEPKKKIQIFEKCDKNKNKIFESIKIIDNKINDNTQQIIQYKKIKVERLEENILKFKKTRDDLRKNMETLVLKNESDRKVSRIIYESQKQIKNVSSNIEKLINKYNILWDFYLDLIEKIKYTIENIPNITNTSKNFLNKNSKLLSETLNNILLNMNDINLLLSSANDSTILNEQMVIMRKISLLIIDSLNESQKIITILKEIKDFYLNNTLDETTKLIITLIDANLEKELSSFIVLMQETLDITNTSINTILFVESKQNNNKNEKEKKPLTYNNYIIFALIIIFILFILFYK